MRTSANPVPSASPKIMNTSYLRGAVALATTLIATFYLPTLVAADKPDYKAVAERIVGQSANVKEGDRVVLRGDVRDLDLIEEIALAVWKRGAEPVQIVTREKAARRYFDEVPAKRDNTPATLSMKLAEVTTVEIVLLAEEQTNLLSDVPPERRTAVENRFRVVQEARVKRGVRLVELGNGLYPTDAIAKRHGLRKEQLAELFWSGINVDYAKLQVTGAAVRSALASGKVVRITHPNGTDFTCRIESRAVNVSDGSISEEDVAKGPPATQVWLPAGEVYVTPVKGTAEGTIKVNRTPFEEVELEALALTFKAGKLTSHTAKPGPGYERWKKLYAAASENKDEFGYVDIGINPNIKAPAGSKLANWVAAGTISVGTGNNIWAGGDNSTSWNHPLFLTGGTLTVDGKVIVEGGMLKVQ